MIPEELDTGPPSEMRSPSWRLGRRGVSIERTTIDIYPAAAQLSSALCAAGMSTYLTRGGAMSLDKKAASRIREFRHLFAGSPPDCGDHPG